MFSRIYIACYLFGPWRGAISTSNPHRTAIVRRGRWRETRRQGTPSPDLEQRAERIESHKFVGYTSFDASVSRPSHPVLCSLAASHFPLPLA